jgi:hypothetical protein
MTPEAVCVRMLTFLMIVACAGLTAILIRFRARGQTWPNGKLLAEAMQTYLSDDPS